MQKSILTQRDLISLALRGMSLLALLFAVRTLPDGVEAATEGMRRYYAYTTNVFEAVISNGALGALTALGLYGFLCGFAFVLWQWADALALFLAGRDERAQRVAIRGFEPVDALTVLLVGGGLCVTASGISLLGECLGLLFTEANSAQGITYFAISFFFVRLLNALLPLGVGVTLLRQGRVLASRYAGAQRGTQRDAASGSISYRHD